MKNDLVILIESSRKDVYYDFSFVNQIRKDEKYNKDNKEKWESLKNKHKFPLRVGIFILIISMIFFIIFSIGVNVYDHIAVGNGGHITSGGNVSYYKPKTNRYGPVHIKRHYWQLIIAIISLLISLIFLATSFLRRIEAKQYHIEYDLYGRIRENFKNKNNYIRPFTTNEYYNFEKTATDLLYREKT